MGKRIQEIFKKISDLPLFQKLNLVLRKSKVGNIFFRNLRSVKTKKKGKKSLSLNINFRRISKLRNIFLVAILITVIILIGLHFYHYLKINFISFDNQDNSQVI